MANDKLTWQELRKAVAEQANTSEQEAGQFLNALLNGLVEGLKKDKQVKVKGLGNFSLKAVAPRKSVNIATGEAFTIEGYNKLTFSPETMLKENVEKRIELPKTEQVMADINNDPLKKLGEQANEIVDILAELGQAVNPVTPPIVEPEEPEVPEEPQEPEVPEEPEEPETPEVPEEPETPEVPEEPEEPDTPDTPEEPEVPDTPDTPKPTGKSQKWVCWLIAALIVLGIIGTGIYFRATLIQWWQCMQDCQPAVEEVVTDTVPTPEEPIVIPLANKPREYVNFIGIERVGENSRLAWIAYKYYAQKDLWVFIYEANRDIIKHPAHVRPGQYIRIPDLTEEYRNLYNPELRQLVDSLAVEYLAPSSH
jgi:nucleoid DNA-binding protein/phage tail protein X